jgi:GNAT superfamily N-acetyltransferase
MNTPVRFRPIAEGDQEFLYRVYASTREDVNLTDWSPQQKEAFLRMQFGAQHAYYQQEFSEAEYSIIMAGDQPIGRLYVDRRPDEIRIIDIALLPEDRGGGIGGQIMQDLLDEAAAVGKPVRIHVLRDSDALHLYDRLGFRKTGDTGVYHLMEWTPDGICAEI